VPLACRRELAKQKALVSNGQHGHMVADGSGHGGGGCALMRTHAILRHAPGDARVYDCLLSMLQHFPGLHCGYTALRWKARARVNGGR